MHISAPVASVRRRPPLAVPRPSTQRAEDRRPYSPVPGVDIDQLGVGVLRLGRAGDGLGPHTTCIF